MDFNDNDFEGQDFQLVGEDSSKGSPVLRPYALPKFDFDDSLHGQLRFDSLVENESFLGITSQEDNNWIEDFSRADNGIDFSPNAPDSCSLPSRINVWSEATSSESVEMLLKAVVQEETGPGKSLTRESNPLNEQGTPIDEMENPLVEGEINTDYDGGNSSLLPSDVEKNVSRSTHDSGVMSILVERAFEPQVSEFSAREALVDAGNCDVVVVTETSITEKIKTNTDLGEIGVVENESVPNQGTKHFPIHEKSVDNSKYPSQKISSVVEDVNAERIMRVISDDKGPSAVENKMNKDGVTGTRNGNGASCMIVTSDALVNQVSGDLGVSYENSIPAAGESTQGFEIKNNNSESIAVFGNIQLLQAPVELSHFGKNFLSHEDIPHASKVSHEAQQSSFMPTNTSEVNDQTKSKNIIITGGLAGEKSISDEPHPDLKVIHGSLNANKDHESLGLIEIRDGTSLVPHLDTSEGSSLSLSSGIKDVGGENLSQLSKQKGDLDTEVCLSSDVPTSFIESVKVSIHESVAVETNNGEGNNLSQESFSSAKCEPSNEVNKTAEPSAEMEKTLEEEPKGNDKEDSTFLVGHQEVEHDKTNETGAPHTGADEFSLVKVVEKNSIQEKHIEVGDILLISKTSEGCVAVEEGKDSSINASHSSRDQSSSGNKAEDLTCNTVPNISSPSAGLGSSKDLKAPNRRSRRASSKAAKGGAKRANQVKEAIPMGQIEKVEKPPQIMSPFGSSQFMNFDRSVKPRGTIPIPASALPDLNTSTPPSAFFRQPFTDLQQVQLRAQILVYGSLIQGSAPDEACMISAFDGDRSPWELSWRACVERLQLGKSKGIDAKGPDSVQKQSFPEGEVFSPAAHARKKASASPVVNSLLPSSSPLWTMSTVAGESHPPIGTSKNAVVDYQIVSSMSHYQTPPTQKHAAHSSWSTLASFPWLAPTQSSFDFSTNHPAFPLTTPLKPSPIADASLPTVLGSKNLPLIPTIQPGVPTDALTGPSVELKHLKVPSEQNSDKIPRRKKKSSDPEAPRVSVTAPFVAATPATVLGNFSSGQISFIPQTRVEPIPTASVGSHYSTSVTVATPSMYLPKSSTNQFLPLNQTLVSGDILKGADLAVQNKPLNAETFRKAEEAMQQAQEAGASAASAIKHCESVWSQLGQATSHLNLDIELKLSSAASAIAAAASVAKAAAASAKIAENVAALERKVFEETLIMSQVVISSSLSHPTTSIAAAREAARKRVEAASAAARQAENIDAIAEAAELATEAVSHAEKIVNMARHLPLSKLVEAGPSNYWKDQQQESLLGSKPSDKGSNRLTREDRGSVPDLYRSQLEGPGAPKVLDIKEGSHVEVLRDFDDSKKAWFSASVLALNEGEVLVGYTDLPSTEGSEKLKEWVPMEAKENTVPRVRNSHPHSSVTHELTRKRPRDASREYNWSPGDKVDAWIKNCWCEGIISEKSKKDESVLCVKFPDQETTFVKVWHVRPTLNWNGSKWVEVPISGSSYPSKGDTPAQKRPKVANMVNEISEKGKQVGDMDLAEIPITGPTLPLAVNEKKFSIGEVADNKPKAIRGTRSVLAKERSRVVFGVPKPGKKRKFMEVSKHYTTEQRVKSNVSSEPARLTKFLTPHGPSSQSSKIGSKLEVKQGFESKTRAARSAKPSNIGRTLARKDDSSSSKPGEGSVSATESDLGEQNAAEHGSTSNQEENSGDTMVFSSEAIPRLNSKRGARSTLPERAARRKIPVPSARSLKSETNEPLNSEAVEPRRSVRRIQPTSRLLEGLQSSLVVSKPPYVSHDKGHSKGTTMRGNNSSEG